MRSCLFVPLLDVALRFLFSHIFLYCVVVFFVLLNAPFVLLLPVVLSSLSPGHLHLLFNLIINVLNSRRGNKAAMSFIYAFEL